MKFGEFYTGMSRRFVPRSWLAGSIAIPPIIDRRFLAQQQTIGLVARPGGGVLSREVILWSNAATTI